MIGQALKPLRAGDGKLLYHQLQLHSETAQMIVQSPAFSHGSSIPDRYAVTAADISPPLTWNGVPTGSQDLVLVVEDYDVPLFSPMVHAIAYHLGDGLVEGALPNREDKGLDPSVRLGRNGLGYERYDGPAPPPGHGPHHYVFQLFALDISLAFEKAPSRSEMEEVMRGHVLSFGIFTGTFER